MFLVLALVEILGIDEIASHLRSSAITPKFGDATPSMVVGRTILQVRRPRDLVRSILAGPPVGLLGVLRRLGPDPVGEPRIYYECARMHLSKDPADRRRVRVLGQIAGNLVGAQIQVVDALDPLLLHPALVGRLYELRQVAEIHAALSYIRARCSGATDDAIRASLGRLKPGGHRSDFVKAWAARFDRPAVEFDLRGDSTMIVLDSAAALVDAGKRFRNCLSDKINEVFLGVYVFVEFKGGSIASPGLIAELRNTSRGFVLEAVYAPGNRRVHPHRAQIARKRLAALGVAVLTHAPGDQEQVIATAKLLNEHGLVEQDNAGGWGVEMLEVDEDLQQILDGAA
ncbi:hypothetical protein [Methylobacterium sp. GXF4]|uniref:hypothetical protein n=1 Tax=Methylobacterium sp. GXF4 TaxID=1096546 RepID=UPI001FCBD20F|nr:hypothetical protein [Methylobacterium sp. GXF4]